MKIIWLAIIACLGITSTVYADQFRIRETRSKSRADVSYVTVIINRGTEILFKGTTDKYGRITIDLPKGQYRATVIIGKEKKNVDLVLDGEKNLKSIYVK